MVIIDSLGVPESYKGYKLDSLLAYTTPRFVRIEDRRLGCLYYILILLIVLWVVGFQILYGNEHYKLFDVLGESRMTIQQPTKNGCNPRHADCDDAVAMSKDLPYCADYEGNSSNLKHKSKCIYADMLDLVPTGPGVNSLFVPTRIDTSTQQRCADGQCKKMWTLGNESDENKNTYVQGIEDYTLMVRSSYLRKGIRGHSFSHIGFYYECTDGDGKVLKTDPCHGTLNLRKIDCLSGLKCHREQPSPPPMNEGGLLEVGAHGQSSRKLRAGHRNPDSMLQASADDSTSPQDDAVNVQGGAAPQGGVYAIPTGDIFTMRKILQLAGLDLDRSLDDEGMPLRQRGTAISVNIEYTNMRPFGAVNGQMEVSYAYRVVEQPLSEVKSEVYAAHQPQDQNIRVVENRHGLILTGKVTGSFGKFNIVYLLVMLTTSLALLGVAKTIVDFAALYLPSKNQEQYKAAKTYVYKPNEPMDDCASPTNHG